MRKNQKYSQEQMYAAIELCQKDGITAKQYCHQNDIPYPSFQYWMRKYRSEQLNDNIVSEQKFVSVHVAYSCYFGASHQYKLRTDCNTIS